MLKLQESYKFNTLFLGDRKIILEEIKKKIYLKESLKNNLSIFEIDKMQISVDDIRRSIGFVNRTSENEKIVFLSSFYWSDEVQNAMLKVLEETPNNTLFFLFGFSEKSFLTTVLSRLQIQKFENTNRFLKDANEILELDPNARLESKNLKKILNLKVIDFNLEKNSENEKKDREAHILFLYALIQVILENKQHFGLDKDFMSKILEISKIAEIEGGSPHLFVEWLLLSTNKIVI